MRTQDLIARKRDGRALAPGELKAFVQGVVSGDVSLPQAAAMLMAMVLNGLDDTETAALTFAMLHSGRVLELKLVSRYKVDKHSTGGVGDKVSLVLAPLVAAAGVPVPMISGRSLGHTGGTLDKLEAIPGFRTDLEADEFERQVARIGCAMIGQTAELAPADRILYGLRDATATVECIPLICASILSKKLAEGIDALVLDVKCGRGAFMKSREDARRLARTMVEVGRQLGKPATALITRMDEPLGRAAGNAVEVRETIACLRGGGPSDLMEVTYALGVEMLAAAGVGEDVADRRRRLESVLDSGQALDRFRALIEAQGGNPAVADDPDLLPRAGAVREVRYSGAQSAVVRAVDALAVGECAVLLGAGRKRESDAVDPAAGVDALVRAGERVEPGDVLCRLHAADTKRLDEGEQRLGDAFAFGDPEPAASLILERIG
ncbi:MAG: thymidine phosphorylase [Puniceicoccaceae bacterium]|nr:MAG: thymidine phosphorylase [Puniceicoccaceae bacterium]